MSTDLAIYETAGLSCGCNHDMDSKRSGEFPVIKQVQQIIKYERFYFGYVSSK